MAEVHRPQLTSSEIAFLWTAYLNDTMAFQVLRHFLKMVEELDFKKIVEHAFQMSKSNVDSLLSIMNLEKMPVPFGFSDGDINIHAPRLFTDTFMAYYILHMTRVGHLNYGASLSVATRRDIRNHFSQALHKNVDLFQHCSDLLLEKGVYLRKPFSPMHEHAEYIQDKSYLSGLNPLKKHRPLNMIEITHLCLNIENNMVGSRLAIGFAQVAKSEEVKKYMLKGKEIAKKHVKIFADLLIKNDLQSPISWDYSVTESKESPFSEKLMMNLMTLLSAAGIGNYATAAAASQRTDLALNYERLSAEIGQYAKEGADIMIKHHWLEKPPTTPDRNKIANENT